jgi:hypothetical protein
MNPDLAAIVGTPEDGDTVSRIVQEIANERRYKFAEFPGFEPLIQSLQNGESGSGTLFVVVILDSIGRDEWLEGQLKRLLNAQQSAHIVVYVKGTGTSGDLAVRCLDNGARDFVVYGSYDDLEVRLLSNLNSRPPDQQSMERISKSSAFVVTPFLPEALREYQSGIRVALEGWMKECNLGDRYSPTFIAAKLWSEIRAHDIIIANITDYGGTANRDNPNVYYEIAYAHGVGKPLVLVRRKRRDEAPPEIKIPSDIQGLEFIPYANPADLAVQLRKRLPYCFRST